MKKSSKYLQIFKIKFFLFFAFIAYSQNSFTKIEQFSSLPYAYQNFFFEKNSQAIKEFKRFKNPFSYYNISYLLYDEKKYGLALDYAFVGLKKSDKKYWFYNLLGNIYRKLGDSEKELKFLKKAIQKNNDISKFHFDLADYYFSRKEYKKADEYYESGLEIDDAESIAHIKRAKILFFLKKYIEALEYLEELEKNGYPEDDFYILKAEIQRILSQKKNAISSYKRYLNFYPLSVYADSARTALKNLGYTNSIPVYDARKNTNKFKIKLGESLTYDVSYIFSVGGLKINVDTLLYERLGKKTARVTYDIYSSVLQYYAFFEVYIDLKTLSSVESIMYMKSDGKIENFRNYKFDEKQKLFSAKISHSDGRIEIIRKDLPINTQDGTGILFFTRGLVANKKSLDVTTVIDDKFRRTAIYFKNEFDEEFALGKSEKFIYIDSKAYYEGIAGMNGEAKGWFSNDGNFIPMVGKMSIIVGSVRVELIKQQE
jgi:tetratricopeptide (TPR) repeat protein